MTNTQTPFEIARSIVNRTVGCRIQFALRMELVALIERAIHQYNPDILRAQELEYLALRALQQLRSDYGADTDDPQVAELLRCGRLFFVELTDR